MNINDKAEKLVIQLTRETYSNNIEWEAEYPPRNLTQGTEAIYPLYFSADYQNISVGLFSKRYKNYTDVDEYYWTESIGFCVLDEDERVTWEYSEHSSALYNLFEAAREQASGIGDILDGLLK